MPESQAHPVSGTYESLQRHIELLGVHVQKVCCFSSINAVMVSMLGAWTLIVMVT